MRSSEAFKLVLWVKNKIFPNLSVETEIAPRMKDSDGCMDGGQAQSLPFLQVEGSILMMLAVKRKGNIDYGHWIPDLGDGLRSTSNELLVNQSLLSPV